MPLPWLLWLDVETTGLSPQTDHLLEVGAVVTDERLRLVDSASRVFQLARVVDLSKVILDMHGANGLLREAAESPYSTDNQQHWDFLIRLVVTHFEKQKPVLAGWNVASFDRLWIQEHAPKTLWSKFQYRHLDLTAIRFCTPQSKQPPKRETEPHRAIFDCFAGVEWLQNVYCEIPGMFPVEEPVT